MNRFLQVAAIIILVASTAACTTMGGGYFTPTASTDAADLSLAAASAIASDMVDKLAEHVGPGTGTIMLKTDETPFATTLEHSLQSKGYAVATDQKAAAGNAIPLSYALGTLDGMVMMRISTPNLELTQTYSTSAAGAVPTSPLTIMQRTPDQGEGA